jgi:hypothetical protein
VHFMPESPYGHLLGSQPVATEKIADDHFDLEQLKGWISKCDNEAGLPGHHGFCHSFSTNSFFQFPSELILVDIQRSKLTTCHQKERYAALSYVWGRSNEAFATVRSNFADLSKAGGLLKYWARLPAVLKDAIYLTKALGIPYLWIDRLCIVQDDAESKQHNISWMASIYANSYLAIVAAEGTDANDGIQGIGSDSGPRGGIVKYRFGSINCTRRAEPEKSKVWHTRGWTFQERNLARRSLVFHGTTVHWECQQNIIQENITRPITIDKRTSPSEYRFDLKRWPDFEQYAELCQRFSRRELRFAEDVMDAFSSTTNALTKGFPGGFLYAMPKIQFSLSLLWTHHDPAKRRDWLPSWSWIGWDGVPAMPTTAMCVPYYRNGDEEKSWERYCCPMARWRIRNSRTLEVVNIDDQYHLWQSFERDRSRPTPKGWEYSQSRGRSGYWVYFGVGLDDLWIFLNHPLPISELRPILPDLDAWDTLLHGTVRLAFLRFDAPQSDASGTATRLHTTSGQPAGELWLSQDVSENVTAEDECLVIAILHTVHIRPNWNSIEVSNSDDSKDRSYCSGAEGFVHMMWVQWKDEIAYRRGTGRMALSIWNSLDTKEIEIVLG